MSQPNGQPQNPTGQPAPASQPAPQQEPGLLNQQQPGDPALGAGAQPPAARGTDPAADQLAAMQAQFASELDRRINQVVSTLRREMSVPQQHQPPAPAQPVPAEPARPAAQVPVLVGPSPLDLQEARSVYREFVADQVTFLGPQEREFAQSLASAEIMARLGSGDRPEVAGRDVAGRVAATVKSLRDMYEKATVEALRKRGQLQQTPGTAPGAQPIPGQPLPGAGQGWADGEVRARQMYANRLPQAQPS